MTLKFSAQFLNTRELQITSVCTSSSGHLMYDHGALSSYTEALILGKIHYHGRTGRSPFHLNFLTNAGRRT
jgi:hypothetical protein